MTNKVKSLFGIVFILLTIIFFSSSVSAQENNEIRVTGFGGGRTRFVLASDNGGAPPGFFFPLMSRIHFALMSESNFGAEGVVSCSVSRLNTLVSYVTEGSLVDTEGNLLFDVFFGAPTTTALTDEEATELAKFVKSGGVLFVGGTGGDTDTVAKGYEYNLLFEKLEIEDRFHTEATTITATETNLPLKSIITTGIFGDVGALSLGTYRKFNGSSLSGIISHPGNNEYIVHEGRVGKGYLAVAGSPFFSNPIIERDGNHMRYFLNLFSLGCDKSWQDNAKVLDVPSFKQGLPPYDGELPDWETHIYDHGNELDLWCDTNQDYASMAECGCALSSASMVTNYHGVKSASGGFLVVDPFSLNLYAKEFFPIETNGVKGFFGGNFNWYFIDNFTALLADENNNQKVEFASRENFSVERIKQLIDEDKPVIVNVIGKWGEHWVVVKGYDPDTNRLIINDPAMADPIVGKYSYLDDLYTPKLNKSMIVYQKTNSDFRRIQFVTTSKNKILVTDSLGNKTGYDPTTNSTVESIPSSSYDLDNFYGDPTNPDPEEPSSDGVYFLTVKLPEDSEYKLQIISQDGEPHPVQVYTSDTEGGLAGKIITPDEPVENHTFIYNEEIAGEEVIGQEDIKTIEASIEVEPLIKSNIIIPHKLFTVPVAVLASGTFDVAKVDRGSVTFGKTGDEKSLIGCAKILIDVNRDKRRDLICYFYGDKLGLDTSDKKVFLKGKYEDKIFVGEDNVNVWKPWFLF